MSVIISRSTDFLDKFFDKKQLLNTKYVKTSKRNKIGPLLKKKLEGTMEGRV